MRDMLPKGLIRDGGDSDDSDDDDQEMKEAMKLKVGSRYLSNTMKAIKAIPQRIGEMSYQ